MYKTQSYDIHASFLVPAYNLSDNVLSHYVTTQYGQSDRGSIEIDVWLVKASQDTPIKSMIESLRKERINYQTALEKELSEGKLENNPEKCAKVRQLEKGKAIFAELIAQAQDPSHRKQPDEEFLKIARNNFTRAGFSSCQPDLQNYLYLTGLSRYTER